MGYKAFKFLLKPNTAQEQTLVRWMGMSRWVCNWCLTENKFQRREFTHKISSQITKDYIFVAVEDLNIKGMMTLAKSIAKDSLCL
jgi:transposase